MPTRPLVIILALSPIAFLICVAGFAFAFDTVLGSLLGDIAIFVPLAMLAFSNTQAISPGSRRWLRWALISALLLLPALAMHFAPALSMKYGSNDQIHLDPPPHAMPAQGAAYLRGLNVKDGVMILKSVTGASNNDPSPFSACDYLEWFFPPSHFTDENGNGVEFKLIGDNLLHLQDDRGGYADIKWDGAQFTLVASHSAGQAASARSASRPAALAGKFGNLLLILCPMLAWLLITMFAMEHSRESMSAAPSLTLAGLLQLAAMAVLAFAILAAPASPDEVSGGLLVLFVLTASACSITGLSILAWNLIRCRI